MFVVHAVIWDILNRSWFCSFVEQGILLLCDNYSMPLFFLFLLYFLLSGNVVFLYWENIDFIFVWESIKLVIASYEFEAEGDTEQKSKQHEECFIH